MDSRLNPYDNATVMKFVKHLNSSGAVVTDSKLPPETQEPPEQYELLVWRPPVQLCAKVHSRYWQFRPSSKHAAPRRGRGSGHCGPGSSHCHVCGG